MNEAEALDAFSALSNKTRLRMLRELVTAGAEGRSAGDLAVAVGASPSRASFHLSNLAESGLVTSSQSARQVIYVADFEQIGGLVNYFLEDCCSGDPNIRACCVNGSGC